MEERRALTIMTVALRAGEVMLANSVSVGECDAGLRRICNSFGLPRCEVLVELSSITLSYLPADLNDAITLVRTVETADPQLHRLVEVERLIRRIEAGDADLDTAWDELERIAVLASPYPRWVMMVAHLVSTAGWVIFAGGNALSVVAVVAATALIFPVLPAVRRGRIPEVFIVFVGAAIVTAVPYAMAWAGLELVVGAAVIGGLYQFLPGALLVASVTDGLSNAPMSSLARGLQAMVTATGIALAVLAVLSITAALEVSGSGVSLIAWGPVVTVVAAGVAIGGLAIAREVPLNMVGPTALLGMIVYLIAYAAPDQDWGQNAVVAVAAFILGAGGQVIARAQQALSVVYIGVAVLVLVPGARLYQAMLLYALDNTTAGNQLLFEAVAISAAIAAGTTLGIAVGRSMPKPRPPLRFRPQRRGAGPRGSGRRNRPPSAPPQAGAAH